MTERLKEFLQQKRWLQLKKTDWIAAALVGVLLLVVACPGGCVGGGGQPIHDGCEFAERRGGTLYRLDSERKLRFSHENPEVQKAYEEFLGKPLSRTAHKLLHSEHVNELYFETHNYL